MPLADKSSFRLSVDLDVKALAVEVKVIDRESDKVTESEIFPAAEVPENLRPLIGLYGLSKKLQDSVSDTPAGPGKLAAMREFWEILKGGTWERERKSGSPTIRAEVEALAEIKGISVGEAQAALRKYDKATQDKILANPDIVAKAKAIREKREAAEGLDLSNLAVDGAA